MSNCDAFSKGDAGNSIVSVILRSVSVWSLIIAAETINGTLRASLLVPSFGEIRARQISFGVALVLILSIAILLIRWIEAAGTYQLMLIGAIWAAMTFCFEAILGAFVLGMSWERIIADYDITRGGMMSMGLVFMLFAPLLASKLRESSA